ncbi:hypothetical protein LCGC14_2878620 [marine sediment metagenome]|uniref:Uncharacterized protein n=1 Tax=marine sediment metagenome TaxID=412755 RepID=A0A0F8Y0Q8_9ZZZZ
MAVMDKRVIMEQLKKVAEMYPSNAATAQRAILIEVLVDIRDYFDLVFETIVGLRE